jgi:hypothetical protein
MKRLATILVVASLSTTAMAADVSGNWNLEMSWPGSDVPSTGVCSLKQDVQKLTGECGDGTDKFAITGEVNGEKLAWQLDVEQGNETGKMAFSGVLNEAGTTVKGACSIVGQREGSFIMKKQ